MSRKMPVSIALPILAALAAIPGSGYIPPRTAASGAVQYLDSTPTPEATATTQAAPHANKTVFLIVMENTNWSSVEGSDSAPYINQTLLPMASYAREYYNPPGLHPSEPNYLWLEAGTNFGVTDDSGPSANHQSSTMHLVTLLDQAGISWKSYQEDITGTACPLKNSGLYAPQTQPDDLLR